MKRITSIALLFTLTGCATVRRHPALSGVVAGAGIAVVVGLKYHDKGCPSTYDGHAYQGTPWGPYPCPQYGGKK